MISRKGKYAVRAALYLAQRYGNGVTPIAEIATAEKISRKFLESILLTLKNEGILESTRGKGGGYALQESPERITIGQIIRLVEGPLAPVSCVSRSGYRPCPECPDEATCPIRLVMKEVRDAISQVLDQKTLASLAEEVRRPHDTDWFMVGI